jgi:hypothetical protein
LEGEEWTEDDGGGEKRKQGDADETPEVKKALLKQCAEASFGSSLIAEESSGYEEEVDEKIERDGGMTHFGSGIAGWSLVEVEESFAQNTKIEAIGQTLRGERVIQQLSELEMKADRKENGKSEIEEVRPEERWKAAQREGEAVGKDAALRHAWILKKNGKNENDKASP